MRKRLYAEFASKLIIMVSINELKQRFIVRDVAPYGSCIVVPGDEFNPDWEAELDIDVIQTDFGDPAKPFTLIPLKGEKPSGIPVLPEKEKKAPEAKKHRVFNILAKEWSREDIERLLTRWPQVKGTARQKSELLAKEFPERKQNSIYQKYWSLQKKTKAESKVDKEKPKNLPARAEKIEPRRASTKEHVVRTDLADALAALVEAVGPENIQFSISIQIGSKTNTV
jgi:hypothetical protein